MAYCDTKLSFVVIFIVTLLHVIIAEKCRTPNGSGGVCIALDKCTPLLEINNRDDKSSDDLLFLRQSTCGFGLKPKVCCPAKSEWLKLKPQPVKFPESEEIVGISETVSVEPLPLVLPDTNAKPSVLDNNGVLPLPAPDNTGKWSLLLPNKNEKLTERFGDTFFDQGACPATLKSPEFNSSCCGEESSSADKIIDGEVAAIDQFPWMALLEYNGGYTVCAGSLISSRYVLTAAHCFRSRYGVPQKVRLSEYNTTSFPKDEVEVPGGGIDEIYVYIVSIERSIIHPGYRTDNLNREHDIALVKLAKNAPYTEFIRPICLPTYDITTSEQDRLEFSIAGWGSTGRTYSDVKLYLANVPYMPLNRCNTLYKSATISENQICAGGEKNRDSCKGDSGGPLMVEINNKYVLAGVVSFGDTECGKEGVPAVYTYVYKYLDWIRKEMA